MQGSRSAISNQQSAISNRKSAIENPHAFNQQSAPRRCSGLTLSPVEGSAIENQQSGSLIARKILRTHTRDASQRAHGRFPLRFMPETRGEPPQRGVREPTKTSGSTSPRNIRVGEGVGQETKSEESNATSTKEPRENPHRSRQAIASSQRQPADARRARPGH